MFSTGIVFWVFPNPGLSQTLTRVNTSTFSTHPLPSSPPAIVSTSCFAFCQLFSFILCERQHLSRAEPRLSELGFLTTQDITSSLTRNNAGAIIACCLLSSLHTQHRFLQYPVYENACTTSIFTNSCVITKKGDFQAWVPQQSFAYQILWF